MKGTHSPRQAAFNYLADQNHANEASWACHSSGKAPGRPGTRRSARAAEPTMMTTHAAHRARVS